MPRKTELDPLLFTLFETKPSKGDQKKAEIVHTALQCLVEGGISEVGFESIAKKMGTRRSHIAYYFKDIDEILESVFRYLYSKTSQSVSQSLGEATEAEDALDRYLNSQFDWFGGEKSILRAKVLFYNHAITHEKYRRLQNEVRRFGEKRLENILKLINKKLNAKQLEECAESIQALIAGHLLFAVTTSDDLPESVLGEAKAAARMGILKLIS